jgi:hypothetical protein
VPLLDKDGQVLGRHVPQFPEGQPHEFLFVHASLPIPDDSKVVTRTVLPGGQF